jgi:hypothetical protein
VFLAAGPSDQKLEDVILDNLALHFGLEGQLHAPQGTMPQQAAAVRQGALTAALGSDALRGGRLVAAAARRLNLTRRAVKSAIARSARQDASSWGAVQRAQRKDAITEETKQLVRDFWKSPQVSRESSSSKEVLRKRGCAVPQLARLHWQEMCNLQVYKKFRVAHPDVDIGLRMFEQLKPWNVRRKRRWVRYGAVVHWLECTKLILKCRAWNML